MKLKKGTRLIDLLRKFPEQDDHVLDKLFGEAVSENYLYEVILYEDLKLSARSGRVPLDTLNAWLAGHGFLEKDDPVIKRGDQLLDEIGQRLLVAEYYYRDGLILVDIMNGRTWWPDFEHGTKLSTLSEICKRKFTLFRRP